MSPTADLNAALRARIAELENEVAYLRSELGLAIDLQRVRRVCETLEIPPRLAHGLLALHDVAPRILTPAQIDERVPSPYGCLDRGVSFSRVLIYGLRRRLGREAVELVARLGYRIGPTGKAAVIRALAEDGAAAAQTAVAA